MDGMGWQGSAVSFVRPCGWVGLLLLLQSIHSIWTIKAINRAKTAIGHENRKCICDLIPPPIFLFIVTCPPSLINESQTVTAADV